MRTIFFDLSKTVGFACYKKNGKLFYGFRKFDKPKLSSDGIIFYEFRKWVYDLIINVKPDVVGVEKPHLQGWSATKICVGMYGIVEMVAHEINASFYDVHTGTLKKWFAGHGKASKEEMILTAKDVYGIVNDLTDDEADALAGLHYMRYLYEK